MSTEQPTSSRHVLLATSNAHLAKRLDGLQVQGPVLLGDDGAT